MDREGALIRWLMGNDDRDPVQYLADLMRKPAWMDDAACRGQSTDLFFSGRGESTAATKAVCQTCPVSADCLMYALDGDVHDDIGIWGGTSAIQRRKLRDALPRPADPRCASRLAAPAR
jgi:WhiB family transcriptional regulator, redox-sensing transcriptional regulator